MRELRPWSCRCMCVEPLAGGGTFFSCFFIWVEPLAGGGMWVEPLEQVFLSMDRTRGGGYLCRERDDEMGVRNAGL